jgi:outer membrane protein OmpA-like peptidoglycan-associated protein
MYSEKSEGSWSKPEILSFVKDGVNYRQPAFFADGSGLIFSANIEESTRGYDLYISYFLPEENSWSEPISIGGRINSEGNETFPSFHNDTLYYSSDQAGMGGLDVFRTYPLADGSWAPAMNLLAPINSGYDDFAFVIDPYSTLSDSILQTGYFCSSRQGGKGKDDIYRFEKVKYAKEKPEEVVEFEYEIVLDFRTYQKLYEDPDDPNSKVKMRVPLSDADIRITEDGNTFSTARSDQYGILTLKLNPEKDYIFYVSHNGFFNNQETFSTTNLVLDSSKYTQRYEDQILLEKVFYDKEVVLENIYYDLDRAEIRSDAEPALNNLAELLNYNPQIKIQLSSHTDCRADDDYNIDLSQRRADSAIQYLMEKGIAASRLLAVGYGETRLAVTCICEECTEDQHQANRRTTFKVIE